MRKYILSVTVLVLAVFIALFAGNTAMDSRHVMEVICGGGSPAERVIIFQIRIPRILASLVSGAALAVSGYLLQDNLNNIIASPGLLGINNGAGLFVLISALVFPYKSGMKCLMSFTGALLSAAIVCVLSIGTGMSKTSVILSGVAGGSLMASLTQVIISLKPETVADKAAFSLGGFANTGQDMMKTAIPVIITALILSLITAGSLDLMLLGDETATGLGVNVTFYRLIFIALASLLAGAAVSMCGLIGFVGLMVPNFIRMAWNGKSRENVLRCILTGAAFLLLADTAARLIVFPYELPCGLITNILGTPSLICVLAKKRKRLGTYD